MNRVVCQRVERVLNAQFAMDIAVDEAKKSSKDPFVLAGAGSNSTQEAISLAQYAEGTGADPGRPAQLIAPALWRSRTESPS